MKKQKVEIIKGKDFGDYYSFKKKKNHNVIIVCYNKGRGLVPYKILLPHQLYVKDVREKIKELQLTYGTITIIPASSDDYIDIENVGNFPK